MLKDGLIDWLDLYYSKYGYNDNISNNITNNDKKEFNEKEQIKSPKQNEYLNQCAVFHWAKIAEKQYPHLKYLHSSINGVRLNMGQAIKAKRAGMKKGIPDICLPFRSLEYTQLFIEMKAGRNKMTAEQKDYMQFLVDGGAYYSIAYSALEAIDTIKKYVVHCPPLELSRGRL